MDVKLCSLAQGEERRLRAGREQITADSIWASETQRNKQWHGQNYMLQKYAI
jgi:hypothetical protein